MTWKGSFRLPVAVPPVVLPLPSTALLCLAARPTAARAASPFALGMGCRAMNCSATDEAARRYARLVWATAASHLEHVLSRTEPQPGFSWWVQCKKHHSFLVTWFSPFCFILKKSSEMQILVVLLRCVYIVCVCARMKAAAVSLEACPFEIHMKLGGLSLGIRVFTCECLWVTCLVVLGRKPLCSCMSVSYALTYLCVCVYICKYIINKLVNYFLVSLFFPLRLLLD